MKDTGSIQVSNKQSEEAVKALEKLRDKAPNDVVKRSIEEKLKYINKPICKR